MPFTALRFLAGLFIGSFLNVVILRYRPGRKVLGLPTIGGRSHCRNCLTTLKWYELIPLLSFFVQKGKCTYCEESISWHYPTVELIAAFVTAFIPNIVTSILGGALTTGDTFSLYAIIVGWLLVSYALIVAAAIDVRHMVLPDQINALIAGVGLVIKALSWKYPYHGAFTQPFSQLAGGESFLINLIFALLAVIIVFGGIIAITRGKGMGLGDLKLGLALALLLGWPDVGLVIAISFVLGAIFSLGLMIGGRKGIKDAVPFGPFIIAAVFVVILYGHSFLNWYFTLIQ